MKLIFFALLGFGVGAQALTLKETKIVKGWQEETATFDKSVKEKCGKDIKSSMDEGSWVKAIPKWLGRGMTQGCEDTMGVIATMCEDADSKAAIVKKINSVKCFPGAKDDDMNFELSGGVLKVTMGLNGYPAKKAKAFLEDNL